MIIRNEEHHLVDCLESIREIVDEIVIVDTGSTDQGKTIAESFGARVFDFTWCNDFAAARNESLRHSRGQWILYIDADERVRNTDRTVVEKCLTDHEKVAYTVRFRPYLEFTAYREFRLFRNDPRIRFNGHIHETILPSLNAVSAEDATTIGHCDLTVEHVGYEGSQDHKHNRNLPLLKEQLKEDPKSVYCWWHLGWVLKGLGDEDGAEGAWQSAIKVIREKQRRDMADSLPYADLARLWLNNGKDVKALVQEALKLFPNQYLLMWIEAQTKIIDGKLEEAIFIFKHLISVDAQRVEADRLAYDERIFGVFSYEPLANCCFKIGRYEDAAFYYELCASTDPHNFEYKIKHQLATARMKKTIC
jgi:tetratricopeptide (TPR) repeat protein